MLTEEQAWGGGYGSARGSLSMTNKGVPRLIISTTKDWDSVREFGSRIGAKAREVGVETVTVMVSGEPLHKLMVELWPYLTVTRKKEYIALRRPLPFHSTPQVHAPIARSSARAPPTRARRPS